MLKNDILHLLNFFILGSSELRFAYLFLMFGKICFCKVFSWHLLKRLKKKLYFSKSKKKGFTLVQDSESKTFESFTNWHSTFYWSYRNKMVQGTETAQISPSASLDHRRQQERSSWLMPNTLLVPFYHPCCTYMEYTLKKKNLLHEKMKVLRRDMRMCLSNLSRIWKYLCPL